MSSQRDVSPDKSPPPCPDPVPPVRQSGELYPLIKPYNTGWLTVSDLHQIYYEECGNKDGNPIVFLHGGPGGKIEPLYRQFMDPKAYRMILFDQRGCGKSKPSGELKENTTWDLVSDIEKLREHFGITQWVVLGGSWGSALALAYAEKHPQSVKAIVVACIFTMSREEQMWVYKEGASFLFPDKWEKFIEPIPSVERGDLLGAYHRRLTGPDKNVRLVCARAWEEWKINLSSMISDPKAVQTRLADEDLVLTSASLECNYCVKGAWFPEDNYLLNNVDKIRHIPGTIIHGRYDVLCPMKTAWELHKRWVKSELVVVPDAGHSPAHQGLQVALIEASDKYRYM